MRRGISFAMRDDGRDRAFIGARIWWPTAVVRKGGSYREEGSRGDTPRLSDSIIIMPHFFNMNTRVSMVEWRRNLLGTTVYPILQYAHQALWSTLAS